MKDFIALVKAISQSNLIANTKKKNGKTKISRSYTFSMLLIAVMMSLTFTFQFIDFFLSTKEAGYSIANQGGYLLLANASYMLFGLCMSIIYTCPIFFRGNDDLFLSMPIEGHRFFLAKLVLSIYVNFIYGGLSLLIGNIVTCVFLGLSFSSYLFSVLFFLLYCLVTPCIGFIVNDFLSVFIDFKKNKVANLLLTLLWSSLAISGYLLLSYADSLMTNQFSPSLDEMNQFICNLSWFTWIGYLPTKGILLEKNMDILFFVFFIAIVVLLFFLTLFIAKKTYIRSLSRNHKEKKKKKENKKNITLVYSPRMMLLKREFSTLSQENALYIRALMYGGSLAISFLFLCYLLKYTGSTNQESLSIFTGIFLLVSSFDVLLPSVSLSLEKKNLSMLKSMPLDLRKLIRMKILPSLLVYLPYQALLFILFLFASPMNFDSILSLFLLSFSYPIMIISFSFLMGCVFPNFNYQNLSSLMKKGAGITISSIAHFVFAGIGGFLLVVSLVLTNGILLGALFVTGFSLVFGFVFYLLSVIKTRKILASDITF